MSAEDLARAWLEAEDDERQARERKQRAADQLGRELGVGGVVSPIAGLELIVLPLIRRVYPDRRGFR